MTPDLLSHNSFAAGKASDLEPLSIVREIPLFCAAGTRILDIGAGLGRNAIFLARHGFEIDALDISEHAISILQEYAQTHSLPMRAKVYDVREADPAYRKYTLILCTFVLHYLTATRARVLLANARFQATPGTVHVLATITRDGDFHRKDLSGGRFYPNGGELRKAYADAGWIIHRGYEEERIMRQTHSDGKPMHNMVSFLIAQRLL